MAGIYLVSKWSFKLTNQKLSPLGRICISWPYAKHINHIILKQDVLQANKSAWYHHHLKGFFVFLINKPGNSGIVQDASVHFARQIKCSSSGSTVPGGHADISPVSKWEPSVSRQQGSFLRDSERCTQQQLAFAAPEWGDFCFKEEANIRTRLFYI